MVLRTVRWLIECLRGALPGFVPEREPGLDPHLPFSYGIRPGFGIGSSKRSGIRQNAEISVSPFQVAALPGQPTPDAPALIQVSAERVVRGAKVRAHLTYWQIYQIHDGLLPTPSGCQQYRTRLDRLRVIR